MALALFLCVAHVPKYSERCPGNCCRLPHHHSTSQVVYLRGTGGVEIHLQSDTAPIDTLTPEILDVDAVFRDEVDQSTYSLYIGCGGCAPGDIPRSAPLQLQGYQAGRLEPFTQTTYRSVFEEKDAQVPAGRKFSADALRLSACSDMHFSIFLLDHGNRSNGQDIVWGSVVGLGERFTFVELLSFPLYILKNHGGDWNEVGWTWVVWAMMIPVFAALQLLLLKPQIYTVDLRYYCLRSEPRRLLYVLAVSAFAAGIGELITHLVIAQTKASVGPEFGIAVGVIVVAHGGGLALALSLLKSTKDRSRFLSRWSSPLWAPVELLLGLVIFVMFGSGFYIGPAAISLAACYRFLELWQSQSSSWGTRGDVAEEGSDEASISKVCEIPLLPGAILTEEEAQKLHECYVRDTLSQVRCPIHACR